MSSDSLLYLWFDRDPLVFEPDTTIPDVPGTADIDLLSEAVLKGTLGTILPARIHMSTHKQPASTRAVRSIDVGRLLRDIGIEHRRCYQITLPD